MITAPPMVGLGIEYAALMWEHKGAAYMDWIKISDTSEDADPVNILGHIVDALVEYEAQKRSRLLDNPPPTLMAVEIAAMSSADVEAYGDAVRASVVRVEEVHVPWIREHGILVTLPKGFTQSPGVTFQSIGLSLLKSRS